MSAESVLFLFFPFIFFRHGVTMKGCSANYGIASFPLLDLACADEGCSYLIDAL